MSRNGSGTYSLPAGNPVVTGTTISSTDFNNTMTDIATALTQSIAKDGQTTPTANIPMGTYKITGLGAGTAATDAAQLAQVQSGVAALLGGVAGTNTITATGSPTLTAYASGQTFRFIPAATNTGATTINIDSLGAKNIYYKGAALAGGEIQSGVVAHVTYDGTQFALVDSNFVAPAGTVSLPGITFAGDTDSGFYRIGANNIGAAANGAKVLDIATTGLGITGVCNVSGVATFSSNPNIATSTTQALQMGGVDALSRSNSTGVLTISTNAGGITLSPSSAVTTVTGGASINGNNRLLVINATASGNAHNFNACNGGAGNAAACGANIVADGVSGRSINAGGTINASGADYAEYENNNGLTIAKGQIVGFKADGTLTLTFSEAVRFGVKSTNPSYVGGDLWGSEDRVGKIPEKPLFIAPEYSGMEEPLPLREDASEEDQIAHASLMAKFRVDQQAHVADVEQAKRIYETLTIPAYESELAAFNSRLEAQRVQVDRVAYSGKVPCNVWGATPGDYIIAVDQAGAIAGAPVADPDFAQYKKAVGRVNRILEDGRAEVAVIVH